MPALRPRVARERRGPPSRLPRPLLRLVGLHLVSWGLRIQRSNVKFADQPPPAAARLNPAPAARAPLGTGRVSSARSSSAAGSRGGVDPAALEALTAQMSEMKLSVEGLEKERDFYFNKVRAAHLLSS